MTNQEITLEIAKMDEPNHAWEITPDRIVGYRYPAHTGWIYSKTYIFSLDAIVPVIKKQGQKVKIEVLAGIKSVEEDMEAWFDAIQPKSLCISLLKASGRYLS